jgi:hypothetical protein
LSLSLEEAIQYSGLIAAEIEVAIKDKKLKKLKSGKLKQAYLEKYVHKL